MPVRSYQEERWRKARRESVRRIRRFEDLEQRSQQSREQQAAEALEKRRELRRKQDECMRKPWKRPCTPKKEILKRGDGARRKRAALQRSIEKAADEMRHQAPGAWNKPTSDASCGVQQFIQQQRALRNGSLPPVPHIPDPQAQNQIPWQDVKIAAEQRFQALLGVDPWQQGMSRIVSTQAHECSNHSFCDVGLATHNSYHAPHCLESHNGGLTMASEQGSPEIGQSAHHQPAEQSQAVAASNRSSLNGASRNMVEPPAHQQFPTLSWRNAVGIRQSVIVGVEAPEGQQVSPLGLTFSDLVRQSMNPAHVATPQLASREEKNTQDRSSPTGADHPITHIKASSPPAPPEASVCESSRFTSSTEELHCSREQFDNLHTAAAASCPGELPPTNNATPACSTPQVLDSEAQRTQRPCSASSFSGILGKPCQPDVSSAVRSKNDGQSPEDAFPSQPAVDPSSDVPVCQHQHAQLPVPRMTSEERVHARGNSVEQQSPVARMEQLLQNMQQLQILRHKARQELDSTFQEATVANTQATQSCVCSREVDEKSIREDTRSIRTHVPHMGSPGIQDSAPTVCLPELNMRTGGKEFQKARQAERISQACKVCQVLCDENCNEQPCACTLLSCCIDEFLPAPSREPLISNGLTAFQVQDGQSESTKALRVEAGWGKCNRVLQHSLERSSPGVVAPDRQDFGDSGCTYTATAQIHGATEHSGDPHLPTAQHSELARTSSSATLKEVYSLQSASPPIPNADADMVRTSRKRNITFRTNHSRPIHMRSYVTAATAVASVHEADKGNMSGSDHDMTLWGWVSGDPAEGRVSNDVRSRRHCVRGDSAQSWLSTHEHTTPARLRSSRIPQPPRSSIRPCADLTPLMLSPHSNLPAVRSKEREYAAELSLFEREFQELDSDPEVLAMIRKKNVPKTVAPSPHDCSTDSPHHGCASSRSGLYPSKQIKMVQGKGSLPVHRMHSHSGNGTVCGSPAVGNSRIQGTHEVVNWRAAQVHGLSDSMEMRQLEESLDRLNGRLQDGSRLKKRGSDVEGQRGPQVSRAAGYARKTRGKEKTRCSSHRAGGSIKRPDTVAPSSTQHCAAAPSEACVDTWADAHSSDDMKHYARPDTRLVRTKGSMQGGHTRADMNLPQWETGPGLLTLQDAHSLWRHIIAAGMMATFGSAAVGSFSGWDAVGTHRRKNKLVGRKPGS